MMFMVLEHKAGPADNAERPMAGGEQLEFHSESAAGFAVSEQREAALMAGLGGGTGGDLRQRRIVETGRGERGGGKDLQPGGDLGQRGQRGEQRPHAETRGAL